MPPHVPQSDTALLDPATPPDDHLPRHDATTLTAGGSAALIALGNKIYTLRITRAGKLILTK